MCSPANPNLGGQEKVEDNNDTEGEDNGHNKDNDDKEEEDNYNEFIYIIDMIPSDIPYTIDLCFSHIMEHWLVERP